MAAYPGSQKELVSKASSYSAYVNTAGTLTFTVTNGAASGSATTNSALSTGVWHHVVCVYNGNYAGATSFGKSTQTSYAVVDDDTGTNNAVSVYTVLETALLRQVRLLLEYSDEVWPVRMCAVVYAADGTGGIPGTLITKSDVQILNPPTPQWRAWTAVDFTLAPVLVPPGQYYIGYVADTIGPSGKTALLIGSDATGGVTYRRQSSVDSPDSPFNSTASTTEALSALCLYDAVGRTGREGKALIYIDGALNVSASYSAGIADNANALQICPTLAAQVDELSIWNKALSDVQVATHYTAH